MNSSTRTANRAAFVTCHPQALYVRGTSYTCTTHASRHNLLHSTMYQQQHSTFFTAIPKQTQSSAPKTYNKPKTHSRTRRNDLYLQLYSFVSHLSGCLRPPPVVILAPTLVLTPAVILLHDCTDVRPGSYSSCTRGNHCRRRRRHCRLRHNLCGAGGRRLIEPAG